MGGGSGAGCGPAEFCAYTAVLIAMAKAAKSAVAPRRQKKEWVTRILQNSTPYCIRFAEQILLGPHWLRRAENSSRITSNPQARDGRIRHVRRPLEVDSLLRDRKSTRLNSSH